MIQLTINVDSTKQHGEIQCPFCNAIKGMYLFPIYIEDRYCGVLYLCKGCYHHLTGRSKTNYHSDDGSGNLLK